MESYFTRVTEAYNTLSNPNLRREYDKGVYDKKDLGSTAEQTAVLARQNFMRARELISKKRLTEAVQFLENAIEIDATNPTYHLELGKLLSGNPRRRDEAEKHLLQAKRLDPANAEAYVGLGQTYAKMGRTHEAELMYREALRWKPGHIEAKEALEEMGLK